MQENITAAQTTINTLVEYAVTYGFQVLGALIVLVIGFFAANWACRALMHFFGRKNFDVTLSKFLAGCLRITILTFAIIVALGKFGITIAPFIAALSAMAFGASLAIQGPLSNYGAGVSIILSRPFVVGNTISVAGVSGVVESVTLAVTVLTNEDGVKITVPNKEIAGQILHNSKESKIARGEVGVSYEQSPEKAIELVRQTLEKIPEVKQQPKPQIGIEEFGDYSINIAFRYWVPTVKYFQTVYAVNLAVYNALNQAGIDMPYPQHEVKLLNADAVKGVK